MSVPESVDTVEQNENGESNDENEPPPVIAGETADSPERELEPTTKPVHKAPGKRTKDKLDVQNRMLDILEKDLSAEQDPLEMQFIVMCKRVKQQLPVKEHFGLALKLSGIIEEEIVAHDRRQIIANTQLNTQLNNPSPVHNMQVTPQMQAPPPPAMIPRNLLQDGQMEHPPPPTMIPRTLHQDGQMQPPSQPPAMITRTVHQDGQLFHERQFNFPEI